MIDSNFEFKAKEEDNEIFLKELMVLRSFRDHRFSRTIKFSYDDITIRIVVKKYEIEKEKMRVWLAIENTKNKECLQINFSCEYLCSFLSLDELVNTALLYFKENHNVSYNVFIEGLKND